MIHSASSARAERTTPRSLDSIISFCDRTFPLSPAQLINAFNHETGSDRLYSALHMLQLSTAPPAYKEKEICVRLLFIARNI